MELTPEEKRIWVKGLLLRCPFGQGVEILNCPLRTLRKMPLREKMDQVNNMTDEDIAALVKYHQECSCARMKKGQAPRMEKNEQKEKGGL